MQEGAWSLQAAYDYATQHVIPPTTDDGEPIYVCPFADCHKNFSKRFNLKAHLRVHTGDKPFACSVPGCTRRFMWKSSLTSHEVGHSRRAIEAHRRSTVPLTSEVSSATNNERHLYPRPQVHNFSRTTLSHVTGDPQRADGPPKDYAAMAFGDRYDNPVVYGGGHSLPPSQQLPHDNKPSSLDPPPQCKHADELLSGPSCRPYGYLSCEQPAHCGRKDCNCLMPGHVGSFERSSDVSPRHQNLNSQQLDPVQPNSSCGNEQGASQPFGIPEDVRTRNKPNVFDNLPKQRLSADLLKPSMHWQQNDGLLHAQTHSLSNVGNRPQVRYLPDQNCSARMDFADENRTGYETAFRREDKLTPSGTREQAITNLRGSVEYREGYGQAPVPCSVPLSVPYSTSNVSVPEQVQITDSVHPRPLLPSLDFTSGSPIDFTSSGLHANIENSSAIGCASINTCNAEMSPSLPLASPNPIHAPLSAVKPSSDQTLMTVWDEASVLENDASVGCRSKLGFEPLPRIGGSGTSSSPLAGSMGSSLGSPGIINSPIPPPLHFLKEAAAAPRRPRNPSIRHAPSMLPPISSVTPALPPRHIDLTGLMDDDTPSPLPPLGSTSTSPVVTYSPGSIAQGGFRFSPMPISPLQPFSAGPLHNEPGLCEPECASDSMTVRGKSYSSWL